MNAPETELLSNFLDQLVQIRGVSKQADADAMIARACAQQPDATYLLVQRALLQDQALAQASTQIAHLKSRLETREQSVGSAGSSFLDDGNAWGRSPPRASAMAATANAAAAPNVAAAPAGRQMAPPAPSPAGGAGSFLATAGGVAAGVVGGAFLYQGIQSLMGHHSDANLGSNATPNQHGLLDAPDSNTNLASLPPTSHDAAGDTISEDDLMAQEVGDYDDLGEFDGDTQSS